MGAPGRADPVERLPTGRRCVVDVATDGVRAGCRNSGRKGSVRFSGHGVYAEGTLASACGGAAHAVQVSLGTGERVRDDRARAGDDSRLGFGQRGVRLCRVVQVEISLRIAGWSVQSLVDGQPEPFVRGVGGRVAQQSEGYVADPVSSFEANDSPVSTAEAQFAAAVSCVRYSMSAWSCATNRRVMGGYGAVSVRCATCCGL